MAIHIHVGKTKDAIDTEKKLISDCLAVMNDAKGRLESLVRQSTTPLVQKEADRMARTIAGLRTELSNLK